MELTLENLTAAADDITKICNLHPPIKTKFETKASGAAKNSAFNKFLKNLKMEIQVTAECCDDQTGEYDLQDGDIPLLQRETVEVIREISPTATERLKLDDQLNGVSTTEETEVVEVEENTESVDQAVKEAKTDVKKDKKEKVKKGKKEPKYTRHDALIAAFKEGPGSKTELSKRANRIYLNNGGKSDNENTAKTLLGFVLPSLLLINAIVKNNEGLYELNI